jgi:Fe2+ transport system protein B
MKVINDILTGIYDFFFTLIFHQQIIEGLKEEIAKPYELKLTEFKAEIGKIEANFEHPLIATLVDTLVKIINSHEGADNYLAVNMIDSRDNKEYEIILRRKEGKTPSELVMEQKQEIKELKEKIAQYEKEKEENKD